ncbi:MAG: Phytochrome-like protein cph2 [Deltaproteobacteria bacterium ADurb.Bin510]|nr:MAG: Phytochrome-like protein cph2 [Deltaproteobacteria bacterium ADurb.Bin510]
MIDNRDEVLETMARLKWRGIRFALDDFGTGYSSLSYLKRFPLDRLKIDHSFVSDLPHDEESVGIARAIISLAQSLNLALIAEGVENETQLGFVRNEGCDFIQGYYFSRPLPLESFLELPRHFSLPA